MKLLLIKLRLAFMNMPAGRELVLAHFRQVPDPQSLAKMFSHLLDLTHADDLSQSKINCGGVRLASQDADSLVEQILIQHNICAFHVSSVSRPLRFTAEPGTQRPFPGRTRR